MAKEKLHLRDLIQPITDEVFFRQHWNSARPYLSSPNPNVVEHVSAFDSFESVNALLQRHRGNVFVFGPDFFRSTVPADSALDFLTEGYNLYITGVEQTVPEARAIFALVASDLGIPVSQLRLEAFAGKAGGVSSWHFDHDVNFQVLLNGTKRWLLAENLYIRNPLRSFHPTRNRKGFDAEFKEELFANEKIPSTLKLAPDQTLVAEQGAVLFLPRGHWHEVLSTTDTWSLNVVFKGATWASSFARALQEFLHMDMDLRGYCDGMPYIGDGANASRQARNESILKRIREAAIQAINDIDIADLSLTTIADSLFYWEPHTQQRELVENARGWLLRLHPGDADGIEIDRDAVSIVRRLVALHRPFSWFQLRKAIPECGATELNNLLNDLIEMGLISLH